MTNFLQDDDKKRKNHRNHRKWRKHKKEEVGLGSRIFRGILSPDISTRSLFIEHGMFCPITIRVFIIKNPSIFTLREGKGEAENKDWDEDLHWTT